MDTKSKNAQAESCTLPTEEKPLKPCCACPDTKKKRDDCVLFKGEESCKEYIEAHKNCLRGYGFVV
jgi:cytochrome c oxidase assembly protein subunit 17